MVVTLLGITIDVRLLHALKANIPIEVMPLGMVILCDCELWKAKSPIEVTVSGITVFKLLLTNLFVVVSIMALQFSRESYTVCPASTFSSVKLVFLKGLFSMLVTVLGRVNDFNPGQKSKAPVPMVVNVLGRLILVRSEELKAQDSIVVTPSGNVTSPSPLHDAKANVPIIVVVAGI